jgi:hypothetical protein
MGLVSTCAFSFMSKYLHQSCGPKPMTRVDINDNNQSSKHEIIFIGQNFDEILASIYDLELPAPSPNQPLRNRGYTPLFILFIGLGSPYPWITCLIDLHASMIMTISSCSLIDSLIS